MQGWKFDDLTRTLGKATSRRQVLKGLLGGLAVAVAGRAVHAPRAAAAGCGGSFRQCRQEAADYYHQCRTDGGSLFDCVHVARIAFDLCSSTRCPSGMDCCDGQCLDVQADPSNCGSCFHQCHTNQVCRAGGCVCADGYTECLSGIGDVFPFTCCPPGTSCKPFGGCGQTCDPPCNACQSCQDGTCTATTAVNGDSCGNAMVCCNGQCVDDCPAGQHRDPASCECVCTTGETCGPFCCSSGKVCCPDPLSGTSCRDPNGACGCNTPCGDGCCDALTEECCRAADYTYHCIPKGSGTC